HFSLKIASPSEACPSGWAKAMPVVAAINTSVTTVDSASKTIPEIDDLTFSLIVDVAPLVTRDFLPRAGCGWSRSGLCRAQAECGWKKRGRHFRSDLRG